MTKKLALFLLFTHFLNARELIVIADKNFHKDHLTEQEIKAFFLDKTHFINGERVLVMNRKYGNSLRVCFEKLILHKNKSALERYWQKSYYQGGRPPKVIESTQMLFAYLQNITPSVGYIDKKELQQHDVKVLYRSQCP